MRSSLLAAAIDTAIARQYAIHALLVIRHGRVVVDAAFYPFARGTRHDVASVTKSVTSILAGIAQKEGILDIGQPIVVALKAPTTDARKSAITIEHLLAMRSGLACVPDGGEPQLREMMASRNWVQFALGLPMKTDPDRESSYCSPNFHLVSAAIGRGARRSALDYARVRLFAPLGITDVVWPADPQGVSRGWGDLQLRPRDLAKLGFLYLHDGAWAGEQIVPRAWVRESTTPRSSFGASGFYALGWWTHADSPPGFFEALGRGGQRLSIWPAKDLIVVFLGGGFEPAPVGAMLGTSLVSDSAIAEDPSGFARLRASLQRAAAAPRGTPIAPLPAIASQISGVVYDVAPNSLALKTIALEFPVGSTDARARLARPDFAMDLVVGLDGRYRAARTTIDGIAPMARGAWTSANEFVLDLNLAGKIDRYTLTARYKGATDPVTLRIEEATRRTREEVLARPRH